MNFLKLSFAITALLAEPFLLASASVLPGELPTRLVYEWGTGSRVENIAVRSNGDLVITRVDVPEVYLVQNPTSDSPTVTLIHTFAEKLGCSGIAETTPDVFAVTTGNTTLVNGTIEPEADSYTIYSVSFANSEATTATIAKIADVPQATFLNGMSQFSTSAVLIGDFGGGKVYYLDVNTGAITTVSEDPLLAPREVPVIGNAGINGLHIYNGYLYFTNTGQRVVGRYPIDLNTAAQLANATVLATPLNSTLGWDDFAIGNDGTLFLATSGGNSIERLRDDGTGAKIIAGSLNSTALAQPTAAKFGRGATDKNTLYVTTTGGNSIPVNGNITIGGQLVAIDLDPAWGWHR